MADSDIDPEREKHSYRIVVIGLAVVILAFLVAVWKWTGANDVSTAMGSITGVVGTLVGAFFGIKVGSQGKEKADADRRKAEADRVEAHEQAATFSALLSQAQLQTAMETIQRRKKAS